ncbi:hypothetical protein FACS1894152_7400 [Bacilli bacterium]|nr:hypothetical protein FACS1894152_7400 [Bacilli bacterium]
MKEGLGTMTYAIDGRKYIGEWSEGKRNGHGTLVLFDSKNNKVTNVTEVVCVNDTPRKREETDEKPSRETATYIKNEVGKALGKSKGWFF